MSTPSGYNNPAYCHQYDSSLYDYQYVPEIDPDSPERGEECERGRQTRLVHPDLTPFRREPSESEEFEGSDESNRSIIIEECNNRRVTLICEKRSRAEANEEELYEDGRFGGAYYQDVSLESESGCGGRSLRHQRPLEPPAAPRNYSGGDRTSANQRARQSTTSLTGYQRAQRQHRYEEIPSDDECDAKPSSSVHRYAEISADENGYPTLSREIRVEQSRKVIAKPRATSPVSYPGSFSPPATPDRVYQRTPQSKDFDSGVSRFGPNSPSPIIYSSSPLETNSFEMSELSPPRSSQERERSLNDTFFIRSPKRHPPVGASAAGEVKEPCPANGRCILPKNLQEIASKSRRHRSHSLPSSPKRRRDLTQIASSPARSHPDKKIGHAFHSRSSQSKSKSAPRGKPSGGKGTTPARRNISDAFADYPNECRRSPTAIARSPYKPTTELMPPRTAIITPIFQRKNQEGVEGSFSPMRNFEKMSQAFQSTGNIFRSAKEGACPGDARERLTSPSRIKRNQSVPNFTQSLVAENGFLAKRNKDFFQQDNQKYSTNLDLEYSPKKTIEHVLSVDKSRMSLIEQSNSWSTLESDFRPQCSTCFIFAAVVHLLTATATCAISFYLLSKVGRRYYLDFGLLAGFVNFILGLLGFRSYCWRWLPNRNYVSGFIGMAAFSALTCGGLSYLVTARPMAGDPILDVMGGAICAVSVLTIALSLTGLTMSGCCKAPPPDNRVTDI